MSDMMDPQWQRRQLELGPMFLLLWLSPWEEKRAQIEATPELVDLKRRLFAKLVVMEKFKEPGQPSGAPVLEIIDRHEPLLRRCELALREAGASDGAAAAALDAVFADAALRAQVEGRA